MSFNRLVCMRRYFMYGNDYIYCGLGGSYFPVLQ